MFSQPEDKEKVLGNLSKEVLRQKLISSNCNVNKFLDSFNLEKRVIVCIMEQDEKTINMREQYNHKHTVIYTNTMHDVKLRELQTVTSSDISKTILPDNELTQDIKAEYEEATEHQLASCPNAWGQVTKIIDETINLSDQTASECRCHYRRISFVPIELFSKQPQMDEEMPAKISQPIPRL